MPGLVDGTRDVVQRSGELDEHCAIDPPGSSAAHLARGHPGALLVLGERRQKTVARARAGLEQRQGRRTGRRLSGGGAERDEHRAGRALEPDDRRGSSGAAAQVAQRLADHGHG
jgi:hypothetical protein